MATPFQLTRVRVLNFKSIADCDVQVGRLNLLVGQNSVGKSNLLDALQFLADALNEGISSALSRRGGLSLVRRRVARSAQPVSIEVEASTRDGGRASFRFSLLETSHAPYRVEEYCRVVDGDGALVSEYSVDAGAIVASFPAVIPLPDFLALATHRSRPELTELFAGLAGYRTYAFSPSVMRAPHPLNGGRALDRDGANVAGVLRQVELRAPEVLAEIEDFLRVIAPTVAGLQLFAIGDFEAIEFRHVIEGAGRPVGFSALSASDGTLKALGVLTALFASSPDESLAPLGIEEPEGGLHPAAAGVLLEALRLASEERQVFATTHSPDLLDSPRVQADEVLAVRVVEGATAIGRVDAVGRDAIQAELFTAGELLRADQLFPEGFPTASRATH